LKLEVADWAALAHPGETTKDGVEKYSSLTAAGTALAKNSCQG
jgi:hypothetical protein